MPAVAKEPERCHRPPIQRRHTLIWPVPGVRGEGNWDAGLHTGIGYLQRHAARAGNVHFHRAPMPLQRAGGTSNIRETNGAIDPHTMRTRKDEDIWIRRTNEAADFYHRLPCPQGPLGIITQLWNDRIPMRRDDCAHKRHGLLPSAAVRPRLVPTGTFPLRGTSA